MTLADVCQASSGRVSREMRHRPFPARPRANPSRGPVEVRDSSDTVLGRNCTGHSKYGGDVFGVQPVMARGLWCDVNAGSILEAACAG